MCEGSLKGPQKDHQNIVMHNEIKEQLKKEFNVDLWGADNDDIQN